LEVAAAVKLTFDQRELSFATGIVASLLKRSATTMPVLSNILVEVEENHATFVGTDQESLVSVRVPVELEGTAERLTVPADKLAELVGLLAAGSRVKIVHSGTHVEIRSESNSYKLVTLPADDFPRWQAETSISRFTLTQAQIKALLDATLYALPARDHRRVLMGVLLELRPGTLRFTATDGKKLSRMEVDVAEIEGSDTMRMVVSGKLLADLRKALTGEGPVAFELGERQVCIRIGNVEYRTNVIEGKYPDCDAVIPKEFPLAARLNRDQFQVGARRAGVVSDDKSKSVILRLEDNACSFTSMAQDVGEFDGSVAIEYDGRPFEIAFNCQLLIETLNSFSHPDIRMKLKSESAPTVMVCDEEPGHLCVLMPIKMSEARPVPGAE
jgi:DNA polymerase-3 subunit beta